MKIYSGKPKRFQARLPRPKRPKKKVTTNSVYLGIDDEYGDWFLNDWQFVIYKPHHARRTFYYGTVEAWVIHVMLNKFVTFKPTERGKKIIDDYKGGAK